MTITGQARKAGVMGWPVGHSRSPVLHGWWLERHGIDGTYVPLPVRPGDLAVALRALPILGFAGCNLTIPHKEAAVGLVDVLDPQARRVGAVNTIVVRPDGTLEGRTTDGFGFVASIRERLPDWRAADGPAVVLGAGGGARCIVAALIEDGAREIRLCNRSIERAERLAADFAPFCAVHPWSERSGAALAGAALLVNATSLGMDGQPALDVPLGTLPRDAVVADIVYVPLETPLLAEARARGNRTVDGLGMLLHQARPGFAAWFGLMPEVTPALRERIVATL
jgi:shikimate dehydrogenase